MKNHEELFTALLAGETIQANGRKYRLINGRMNGCIHNTDKITIWGAIDEIPSYEDASIVPRTININGHEVPEPLRVAPKEGTPVFIPAFDEDLFSEYTYLHAGISYDFLKHGVLHLTKEAAIAHANALLSFTKKEEE